MFIRRNNLFIACTSRYNESPASILELLNRLAKVFKDYCGVLNEESVRRNFVLIYELVDEMLDMGFPQLTSIESLKCCVHNEPVLPPVSAAAAALNSATSAASFLSTMGLSLGAAKTKPSSAANQSVIGTSRQQQAGQKNEIYVDIVERLTVLFNANGVITNSAIDGSILMRSFLSGNPELRVALNEDLVIGKGGGYGSVVLDDCNFHECVRLDEFENGRVLHFIPPEGEFSLLNYRVTADFRPPFKLFPTVEETGPYKLELICVLRAEIPDGNHGANVMVRIPVPRNTVSAMVEMNPPDMPGCSIEYSASEKKILWSVRKFNGGSEMSIRARITLDQIVTSAHKRELGPVSIQFEIPMFNVSNLQVRYLRISETHKAYNPCRWVRYITQSSSYVCRLHT